MADGYLIGADLLGRIRRTVDAAEAAPMRLQTGKIAVRLEGDEAAPGGKVFRICTFTGAWNIGESKRVTFKYQTSTPNTVNATNLFWPVPNSGTRDCSIAKDGTAWFLLVPQMYSGNAAVSASITTSSLEFQTLPFGALATSSTATFSIPIYSCSTATAT